MANCPCRNCTERHPACHGKCEKYIAWKDMRSNVLTKMRNDKENYTDHDSQPFWRKHRKDARSKRGQ